MRNVMYLLAGVLIGLLAAGLLWLAISPQRGEPVSLLPTFTPGSITVHVTGAVASPGVYTLPIGSRVEAAIQAAGGFLTSANTDEINLAALLLDGMQVSIPSISGESHAVGGRLNINTASFEELDSLPGIGATAAQNIINYRLLHGPFPSIESILDVPGIGPSTYESIKNLITVGN